jgi:hypothetical protein
MKTSIVSFLFVYLSVGLIGCSNSNDSGNKEPVPPVAPTQDPGVPTTTGPSSPTPTPAAPSPEEWSTETQENKEKGIFFSAQIRSARELKDLADRVKGRRLIPLKTPASMNGHLFRIEGDPSVESTLFVSPAVMSFGKAWNTGELNSWTTNDGLSHVAVSYSVVDPRDKEARIIPTGQSPSFPIPDVIQLSPGSDWKAELARAFPTLTTVRLVPSRPERVELVVGERSYEVTPAQLDAYSFAVYPRFFSTTLNFTKDQFDVLDRSRGTVADWKFRTTYRLGELTQTRKFFMKLNSSLLFDSLDAATDHGKQIWFEADLSEKIREVLQNHIRSSKLNLPYGWENQIERWIPMIQSAFFQYIAVGGSLPPSYPCVPSAPYLGRCAILNYRWRERTDLTLERSWEKLTFYSSDETWVSLTPFHR